MSDTEKPSVTTKILRAVEPVVYAQRTLTMVILTVLTVIFAWQATKLKPDAGYDKSIPLEHPYMQVLKQYQADFGGANNVLVAIINKPGKGELYNGAYLATLKQATDEVFFIPGVDRSRVSSLFTPDVRYVEVVEGGFKGGNVIPAEYAPTPEMFVKVRDHVNKGGHVGRYTTKDQRGAMIYSELLEVDPVTGEKLDYADVAQRLEDSVRGRFMSEKLWRYTLKDKLCQTFEKKIPAAKEGEKPKIVEEEQCLEKGTVITDRFTQPEGWLRTFLDGIQPVPYKYKKDPEAPEVVFQVKKSALEKTQLPNPQYNPDVNVHILGFAKVVGDIIEQLVPVVGFFLLTLVMSQFMLWAYLGSFKLATLPLICSVVAVVWEFGILSMMGKGLDPFAILVPFLILAVSVSHGVQYANAWVGEVTEQRRNSFDASVQSWRRLAVNGTFAILSDALGFALIALIPIDIIREMALNACLGMFAIIVTNKIMMPIMLTWVDVGDPAAFAKKQEQRDAVLFPIWRFLSGAVNPKVAAITILAFGLMLGWGLWKGKAMQVGDSQAGVPELLPDSRYNKDTEEVQANFAIGTDVMKVIAETDPESCVKYSVMEQVDRFGFHMDNVDGVQSTISLPWAGRQVNMAFSEAAPKFKVLPRNQFSIVQAITPIPTSSGLLNSNCSAMPVFIFTKDHKAETLDRIVKAVDKFNANNAAEFFDLNKDVDAKYCDGKTQALRDLGTDKVSLSKQVEKLRKKTPGISDTEIAKNKEVIELNKKIEAGDKKLKSLDKVCPVNFALASAQVGVMAATNQEVKRLEQPMLYIVYAGVTMCVFLSFFQWQSVVAIMVPLATISYLVYAVMVIFGVGLKVATLPVVALAAGIGVDYGLYIYAQFNDGLKAGFQPREAYFHTLRLTGKAVIFTGIALSFGVMTWLWSGLQFQRDMGKLLVFAFAGNMIAAVTFLPAIATFILKPRKLAPGEVPVLVTSH